MIRGNLRLLTLKALDKAPLSGYALMKFIEERIGSKPSPGSIYPLLEELQKDNLVACKKDGRKKVYSLTAEGKENLKAAGINKEILTRKIEESLNMWGALTGQDMSPLRITLEGLRKGAYPIEDIPPEVIEFKIEMARIFSKGLFEPNKKKVKEMLKKAISELKRIK